MNFEQETTFTKKSVAPSLDTSHWNLLKFENCLIKTHIPQFSANLGPLSNYDVVEVVMNESGEPFVDKDGACHILTNPEKISGLAQIHSLEQVGRKNDRLMMNTKLSLRTFMLGQFMETLKFNKYPTPVKVNPIVVGSIDNFLCEEVLFAPIFDKYTQKYLMSSPNEARALLAMKPSDQQRWGLKIVFHTVTNTDMPLDPDKRELFLRNKIQESHFVIPRVPIEKGSASIYCLILNLENPIEEMAFIRNYRSFDPYTKILYVNSNLEMITGDFKKVPYFNGDIDEIFGNLLAWYKSSEQ